MADLKAMAIKTQGQPGLVPLCQKVRKHAKGADWQVVAQVCHPSSLGDQRQENQESMVSLVYVGRSFLKN